MPTPELGDLRGAGLGGIRAVVFDAYGTLFDVGGASERMKSSLGEQWQPLSELWRAKQLQYTWLRSLMGRHADFWHVTADALDFALESLRIDNPRLRAELLSAYERLDGYSDARPMLERLRGANLELAILSNGSPRMLATAGESSGLAPFFTAIVSVEEVGIYKPSPAVYRVVLDRLRRWPSEILFVSANGWDACGAKAAGLRVVWCNRAGQPHERIPTAPDVEIRTLTELPPLLGA